MSDKERIERLEKVLMSALLILKNFPQAQCFPDIKPFVESAFKNAINDCARELASTSTN